mmetsp:Transcript_10588/g.25881  ORF Transcript_10588/g.25881 Transcript_10588/m.25881 type:complete len:1397 (-) Transcript_10588:192-4382(-)|eukprot:CAMPEP_0114496790 /NCGR_PEP_ID=MMETSP0109-20121206/5958_1 /TAXON_ID=29199 /ORGANISM="Chlorarachnion reptans, Strain CCCM449" /LENGTH=1396 /DNA_ID=CAMNT_0001674087 /DNA_START=193 /DNA_END=4383 /DNA_ORIENTATION=-
MPRSSANARASEKDTGDVKVDFTIDTTQGSGVRWWEKAEEPQTIWRACVSNDGLDYYVNTETGETQWEKPEELMTEEELNNNGEWVWIPHSTECYVAAKVLEKTKKKIFVQLEDGDKKKVDISASQPLLRSSLQRVVADLTLLDNMGSPLILHCLRKRFERNQIYTNVGTILISVNPYQRLPLYTEQVLRKYSSRGLGVVDMPPHVYNIAHDAFYGVTSFSKGQSIIISGESGAGKTEATKQCLQYIANVAGSVADVEKKVLQANPILEAYGNAKTLRNDNSSRFGKYLEIFFDKKGRIAGSATENYLLEKIRVVQPAHKERNFHIFYQLAKAASRDLKRKLKLTNAEDYRYLQTCTDVDSIDDARDFKDVLDAFKDLGISDGERDQTFALCSAVLHLGNCSFSPDSKSSGGSKVRDLKILSVAAELLGVPSEKLSQALTTREIRVRGQESTRANMEPKEASETRHALSKFMYGKMFNWIVSRINKSMPGNGKGAERGLSIGILDIFGFEIFEKNSFEQLCINFTNERLQQHFNAHTFKLEQNIYKSEGIQFSAIDYIDNQPMVDLITKKPNGVLPLLDEELKIPRGSDKTFLAKLVDRHKKSQVFKRLMKVPTNFGIKHYAGKVIYDSTGFLEKNRDTLTEDLVELLQGSTQPLLNELYPKNLSISSKQRKSSLASQFQSQLSRLMKNLNQTQPHYIRCIKPNNDKAPMKFVPKNCYEQLLYSGVFEAVAIRKQGFPFRMSHQEFLERYTICMTKQFKGSQIKAKCKEILDFMKCDQANTRIGSTRVLYRAEEHKKLELRRSIKVKNQEINDALKRLSRVDANTLAPKEREGFFIELAEAVSEADKFRVKTDDAERARRMLEAFVEARMDPKTKRELKEAYEKQDLKLLREVVKKCDKEGYRTKMTRQCQELLAKIEDAEAALAVATKSMEEEYLEKAVAMCDEFGYKAASCLKAKELLKNVRKAKVGIQKAMGKMKRKWLNQAIEFCEKIGLDNAQVRECRVITQKVNKCHKMLSVAKKDVNLKKLEMALRACEKIKYRSPLEHECRGLCFRVRRITEELHEGFKHCIEHQVRCVVAAADEISMPGDKKLAKWRGLVKGPYSTFLEAQYSHAIDQKDVDRAIRIMVRRKDLVVEEKQGDLTLDRYPKLKEAMSWAREKWWGSREKRAANMLKHQFERLHAPLSTVLAGEMDKRRLKAVKYKISAAFETIQKIMGQRNTSRLPQRIMELIRDALQNEEVRTEAYICFIKQCTENPEPEKIPQVFPLLALCLSVFPPGEDFEDYLEAWLRDPKIRPHTDKFNCRGLLRASVHHGPDASAGNIEKEEYKDLDNVLEQRIRPLRFAWPSYAPRGNAKAPSWADLMKSYKQKGESLKISQPPRVVLLTGGSAPDNKESR